MNQPVNRLETVNLIVDKVKALPTLPVMFHRVLSLIQDEDTSVNDIVRVISYDPAITARILKVANSAYYGQLKEITAINNAIVVLGFRQLKSLALGIMIFDTMQKINRESSISMEKFWEHSIGCALASQLVCRKVPRLDPDTAFTASLLHDIGKLVLDSVLPQKYQRALKKVETEDISMVDAEEKVIGVHHAEVGGWLCKRWKFPSSLTSAVGFHHHGENADKNEKLLTSIVHTSDILCKRANIGNGGDNTIPPIQTYAQQQLKFTETDLEEMVKSLYQEQEKVASFLSAIE